ncbi:MAG: Asp23/Gls24 family envelope stress response protein [Actinomycetota bacterium]|nr:Asp23/Gls24 family envelope stress response protein [Actinomycetota bacterium]
MTDTSPDPGSVSTARRSTAGSVALLETDRGTTSIDDSVVAKIAALAAREVDGVAALGGALSGALANVVGRIRGGEHRTAGVGVEVGSRQAAVDISCQMQYPASIHEVADSVRQNVIDRIESMTGLEVVEVNIAVSDLVFPEDEEESGQTPSRVE